MFFKERWKAGGAAPQQLLEQIGPTKISALIYMATGLILLNCGPFYQGI